MANRDRITWVGDKETKEFHRVIKGKVHPKRCNLKSLKPENRVEARTAKKLKEQGITDACAHCNVRFKSRR